MIRSPAFAQNLGSNRICKCSIRMEDDSLADRLMEQRGATMLHMDIRSESRYDEQRNTKDLRSTASRWLRTLGSAARSIDSPTTRDLTTTGHGGRVDEGECASRDDMREERLRGNHSRAPRPRLELLFLFRSCDGHGNLVGL